ncbi:Com family DNA-binding transcriptional regulator [Comamonas sp. Z3]|uniref:Com family DNA-binding transcriptional regulator n=1 Tax=Comamonas sp. Z3 TaxID=2601247 RepID=UPI0011E64809|nr:Com family DNA-binding transcriptional regulator [Comamonas sp. Z3]TYK68829.1 Com family DNA-binding transcriptional regulator [Comamonas sp. Z3]
MEEIRCGNCRKKLGEGVYVRLSIKCPRCGAFNQLSAVSATPEPATGPPAETHDKPNRALDRGQTPPGRSAPETLSSP